jgi:hypothetical protein
MVNPPRVSLCVPTSPRPDSLSARGAPANAVTTTAITIPAAVAVVAAISAAALPALPRVRRIRNAKHDDPKHLSYDGSARNHVRAPDPRNMEQNG